jgi:RHS repeat-associated protein
MASVALPFALLSSAAGAQVGVTPAPPSPFPSIDANGVELQSGHLTLVLASVSIGPGGPGSLGYNIISNNSQLQQQQDAYGYLTSAQQTYWVVMGGKTESFTLSGSLGSGTFSQDQGQSSTLTYNSGNNTFTYTDEGGTTSVFSYQLSATNPTSNLAKIVSKTYPAGELLNYYYAYHPYIVGGTTINVYDVQAVTSNLGYQMRLGYSLFSGLQTMSSVVVFNMANEICDPAAASCSLTGSWPSLTIDNSAYSITDSLGRVVRVTTSGTTETITFPGGRQISYGGAADPSNNYKVTSINDGKGTWTYQYPAPANSVTLVFNPDNAAPHAYTWNINTGLPAMEQPNGNDPFQIQYTYDSFNRLTALKRVSGSTTSETDYGYDSRGHLTSQTVISTTPGTPANIVTSAGYPDPATCTNLKICSKPSWIRDANGNQTDYTYDPNSGGIATVTLPAVALPAPLTGSARPQVRYTYTQQSANYRNGSGTVIAGSPVYRLTSMSQCATSSSCAGTSDEVKTTIGYDSNQAILPTTSTVSPGNAVFASTTTTAYYPIGDVKTVDGPVAGTADTTRYYYDVMRQNTGMIGADPDGGGSLRYRATRTTYNAEGQPTLIEAGTATGQGDNDMSTFASLQQVPVTYDGQGRKRTAALAVGATTYRLVQYDYTNAGALKCTAVRMNPNLFGSLPSSACTQSSPSGSFGPDQITQYAYDGSFRVTTVSTGVGTSMARAEVTNTYGPMGELQSIADAKSNLTTYAYDGFYRLVKTRFPNPTGGGSSTTDFEQLTYDPNSNVTVRQVRNNSTITNTYDALNRVTKRLPSSGSSNPTSTYSYDLLGRIWTGVATTTAHTLTNNFGYGFNASGRTETDESLIDGLSAGKKTMQYDVAGRRTRLTWGDGFYVTYDYDNTNEMTAIHENGGTSIQSFAYDDLGRRTSRTANNGTSQNYYYDSASNLLVLMVNGSSSSTSISMGAYSPAGQITSRSVSNDAYAWNGGANTTRSYAVDGQNKYTTIAGATQGYDLKANLASSGGVSYTYGIENTMTTGSSATFLYDAFGRLANSTGSGRFDYDGDQIVSETTTAGSLVRRYVFGPGMDEPLVWYEGTGTGSKRYFDTDEHGSVIRVTDGSGATLNLNTYDEYGVPGSTNSGRFQYTGQAWMPEVGLYYYKARMYSPQLGRFMQPDPIGYVNGPNIYNYVGSDPVNRSDSSGMVWGVPVGTVYQDADGYWQRVVGAATGCPSGAICGQRQVGLGNSYDPGGDFGNSWPTDPSLEPGAQNYAPHMSDLRAPFSPLPQDKSYCSGPYATASIGVSGTIAAMFGASGGLSFNFSHSTSWDWSNPFHGFQFSVTLQGAYMWGPFGAYVGGGLAGGGGISKQPAVEGISYSHGYYGEADAGAGASVGVSGQASQPLGSGFSGGVGAGKYGLGAGIYAGVGKYGSVTYAFKPVGC